MGSMSQEPYRFQYLEEQPNNKKTIQTIKYLIIVLKTYFIDILKKYASVLCEQCWIFNFSFDKLPIK